LRTDETRNLADAPEASEHNHVDEPAKSLFKPCTKFLDQVLHAFHELVHVIQWRLLGPDRFLLSYANGLECFGYPQSPLEAMAYDAETAFASSTATFNVEKMVAEKLGW
jgi:hypothetical protein